MPDDDGTPSIHQEFHFEYSGLVIPESATSAEVGFLLRRDDDDQRRVRQRILMETLQTMPAEFGEWDRWTAHKPQQACCGGGVREQGHEPGPLDRTSLDAATPDRSMFVGAGGAQVETAGRAAESAVTR